MQKFFSVLGQIFNGLNVFLSIVHHLIWIIIGGAILFAAYYIISMGGPAKLIQDAIPTQLLQGMSSQQGPGSQNGPSNQSNAYGSSNSNSQSGGSKITAQQQQCAINVLGQARVMQLLNGGGQPTAQEYTKIKACFPNGYSF